MAKISKNKGTKKGYKRGNNGRSELMHLFDTACDQNPEIARRQQDRVRPRYKNWDKRFWWQAQRSEDRGSDSTNTFDSRGLVSSDLGHRSSSQIIRVVQQIL